MTTTNPTTDETPWATDVEGFKRAVRDDEYAEYVLETGDTLITDTEFDGSFLPYVCLTGDHGNAAPEDVLDAVFEALQNAFDCAVYGMEYDENNNGVLVPYFDYFNAEEGR